MCAICEMEWVNERGQYLSEELKKEKQEMRCQMV